MSQTQTTFSDSIQLPLETLSESKLNPRRRFEGLAELTENIKIHGVLVPLLVRPIGNGGQPAYEILSGARRYRAAKAAGLTEAPVRVGKLDDAAALELAIIDNLQRADVHPLDEAAGYQRLMEASKLSIEEIAKRVSKSASYVYQRLKLASLSKPAQKLFFDGRLSASHAILIARLTDAQQAEALKWCKHDLSVRELARAIERDFHLDLAKRAVFPLDDKSDLAAEINKAADAKPCIECRKRTGTHPEIFPDIKNPNICTDPACFQRKENALVKITVGQHPDAVLLSAGRHYDEKLIGLEEYKWKAVRGKSCKSVKDGIIVQWDGPEDYGDKKGLRLSQVLQVCTEAKCKVHRNPRFDASRGVSLTPAQRAKDRRDRAIEQARIEGLRQLAEKVKSCDLKAATARFADRSTFEAQKLTCKVLGIWPADGKIASFDFRAKLHAYILAAKSVGLQRVLAVLTLVPEFGKWDGGYYTAGTEIAALYAVAKAAKVDIKAIEREFVKAAVAKAGKGPKKAAARKKH